VVAATHVATTIDREAAVTEPASAGTRPVPPVFVQDFEVVACPFDEIAHRMHVAPQELLASGLIGARLEGDRLRGKVAPRAWPTVLAKTVELRYQPARYQGDAVVLPFSWEAHGARSLFPRLDADLEAAPFGLAETQLTLQARYLPPGGRLGIELDRVLLFRIAQWTIRAFLAAVVETLMGERRAP
jgi:hypothetical protein